VTADALILDFGGVLTPSVGRMFRDFERAHDLPKGTIFEAVARAYGDGGDDSPIARLERGELAVPDFERQLAGSLATAGHEVPADGLVERLHGRLEPSGPLWDATRIARDAGIRTGVLSNSWGVDSYPDGLMARFFDDVVISAAVGLRKPDPAIWQLACQRLDVAPERCVFVDDLQRNLDVASSLRMTTVLAAGNMADVLARLSDALGVDVTRARPFEDLLEP
jgi:putative hydrolase of the HAD superfamily